VLEKSTHEQELRHTNTRGETASNSALLQYTVLEVAGHGLGIKTIAANGSDVLGPGASAPKLIILIEAARQIVTGEIEGSTQLDRQSTEPVGDSGIWQHLGARSMSVVDACALVASVSDNLATNALVGYLGLETINNTAAKLGLSATRWVDLVRDERDPNQHPATCSLTSTGELAQIMAELHHGMVFDAKVSKMVLGWLDTSVDLSLGAEMFCADPLAHAPIDLDRAKHRLCRLATKTGSDAGLLVEAGLAVDRNSGRGIAWGIRASFELNNQTARQEALGTIRATLRSCIKADPGTL